MAKVDYPGGVPPTWQVQVHRVRSEDGRWLVYYAFVPARDVREVVLQPEGRER